MATFRKRGRKYQAQVRRWGCPAITKSFHSLKDAKEWARHIETLQDRRELAPDLKQLEQIHLADLVVRYRNEVVPNKKGAKIETIVLNAFLRHPICKKTISNLKTADFALYRDERLKFIKPSSLKRQLAPLQNMF